MLFFKARGIVFSLLLVLLSSSSFAAWDKLNMSLGNDNKFVCTAAGQGGLPIVAAGTKVQGMGSAVPATMYSEDGVTFGDSAGGGSGMTIVLGMAWTGGTTFLGARTKFTMALPPTVTGELVTSLSGRSFILASSHDDTNFFSVSALGSDYAVILGATSASSSSQIAAWKSEDNGSTLVSLAVPQAGSDVTLTRASLLPPNCAYMVGGDPGEKDDEGNEVRAAGHGAFWKSTAGGDFVLLQQDLAPHLTAVDFPSPQVGYIGGYQGDTAYLARTDNGGADFSALTLPDNSGTAATKVVSIRCFDTQRCAVLLGFGSGDSMAPTFLAFTENGGSSFTLDTSQHDGLTFFEKASAFLAMHFVSPQLAILAGENHLVMRYSDPTAAAENRIPCGVMPDPDAGTTADTGAGQRDAARLDTAAVDGQAQDQWVPREDATSGNDPSGDIAIGEINPGGCGCSSAVTLPGGLLLAVVVIAAIRRFRFYR